MISRRDDEAVPSVALRGGVPRPKAGIPVAEGDLGTTKKPAIF